mgnify:CR=1 FL=1
MKRILILTVMLFALSALSACAGAKALPAADAAAFAAQVDPLVDNLLLSINNNDHAGYIRDMDEKMKAASDAPAFANLTQLLSNKIGKYVSRRMTQVIESGKYRTIIYSAKFEGEDDVRVQVSFSLDGPQPLISGLWFNSPKLRAK